VSRFLQRHGRNPKRLSKRSASIGGNEYGNDEDDVADDYESVDEDVRTFGKRNFGAIAYPYLAPNLYNKRFLKK
jgi:hypothetical protein